MWDGFNKRRFPRLKYPCEIVVQLDTEPKPIKTLTENIGAGGVCVVLKKPYDRFSKCRVKLRLGDSFPVIDSLGRIVWTVKTKGTAKSGGSGIDTGIEFVDMDTQSFVLLKKFIEDRIS